MPNKALHAAASLAQAWNRLWFEPVAPYPLAAFRIAFGCYLLGYFLVYGWRLELWFSDQGVYAPYRIPDIAPPLGVAWVIFGVTLAAVVALILGVRTRLTSIVVFLLFEYHLHLSLAISNGAYDRLNTIILVVLCFADSGAAWSVDAHRRGQSRLIPAWQVRLLQFELAAFYFGAGLWKLLRPAWHVADMTKLTLASNYGSPVAFWLLDLNLPDWLFAAMTWAVVCFELVAGFGLFWRRSRPWVIALGTLFHLMNTILLVIPGFLNCIALYALFLDFGSARRCAPRGNHGDSLPTTL